MQTFCVATAIIQDGDKFFIAKRANTKKIEPGLWEFVTGFVEDHESAEDTILRELLEEINAQGTIICELDCIQMLKDGTRWIVIPFLVSVDDTDIHTVPEEHSAGDWVTWQELEHIPAHEFRYNLSSVKRALHAALTLNQ
ncbi:MAG TPA: NUDIX hydrolase [Candidatus Saccharimonadales bacterium]